MVSPSKRIKRWSLLLGGTWPFHMRYLRLLIPEMRSFCLFPTTFNHEMAITIAGCTPVLVPTDASYQLSLKGLESAITPRTRAIVTVSPNNPTGVIYPKSDLNSRQRTLPEKRDLSHP